MVLEDNIVQYLGVYNLCLYIVRWNNIYFEFDYSVFSKIGGTLVNI